MLSDKPAGTGRAVTALAWTAAAALSWGAATLAVQHATPVDAALPLIAMIVTAVAWAGRGWTQVAVPALIVVESASADETLRLLLCGAVLAIVFASALTSLSPSRTFAGIRASTIAVSAVLLLRWIPIENVPLTREILLCGLCVAITWALGSTPFGIAIAVIVVFLTPAVPLRTLALPLAVLLAALAARAWDLRRPETAFPAAATIAVPLLFFAWSGVMARAPHYFLQRPAGARQTEIHAALPPGERLVLDVPDGATSLVVSGANVAHLPAGAVLGTIAPGGRTVRIGDAADWGFLRREQFYASYNALPRSPAGRIRGYGYSAWVDGAGRIAIPKGARTIEVTAAPTIPSDAALQVEGFELRP